MLPLKEQVKQRDKVCQNCGSNENLTVDHVIPLVEGGKDTFENLTTLCYNCNFRKGPVPPFWTRIVNLFNGNLYWFKNDIRNKVSQIKAGNEKFRQSIFDVVKQKLNDVNSNIGNVEKTNVILIKKYDEFLKQNAIMSQRILQLQIQLGLEWNEETLTFNKIKKPRGRKKNEVNKGTEVKV